ASGTFKVPERLGRAASGEAISINKVKVGVIGIGQMGSTHALKLSSQSVAGATLAAVADPREERLEWAQQQFGDQVARFATADELIDSGLVDAVVIANTHFDHPQTAIKA